VEAKSPLAAALEVEQILQAPSFRPCFEVIRVKDKALKVNIIDLEERKVK
jgi:hypothetical protein